MSDPKARKRRDRDRAVDVDKRHYEGCRASWEAAPRIVRPLPDAKAPDGKRIAADLNLLHELTGDPAFRSALLALKAYRLAGGAPRRSAEALWERTCPEWVLAPLLMFNVIEEAKANGTSLSERAAAASAVAKLKLPATSFDAAVDALRKRYADAKRHGFPTFDQSPGEVGKVLVIPIEGRNQCGLPKEGAVVPNNLRWRQIIDRGDVSARVIGWCELAPNKTKT